MKNYAVIEDGVVTNIVIADEDWTASQDAQIVEYTEENPAFVGGDYTDGFFYRPKPYASWLKDSGDWVPPTPMPEDEPDGFAWIWNEELVEWSLTEIPAEA